MSKTSDVIIIGAGVIGAAIAYELSRRCFKTLTVDRNRQVGHGSTAGSCACIRMHYSTFDGTALAWEGYHYWRDWPEYLHAPANVPLSRFVQTGCLVMKTDANGFLAKHMQYSKALGCPFEDWSADIIIDRLPLYNLQSFAPARSRNDPNFGQPNGSTVKGGVYWPNGGYVTDPALSAQNLADAACRHGAQLHLGNEVVEVLTASGRVSGVRLASGESLLAPIVINVAGPASSKINSMADVLDDMTISTRALRQEVVHIPAPQGFDFERDGMMVSDSDIALYCRPEQGNHILIGSEDPECDPHQWVEDDTDFNTDFTEQWNTQAMRYAQRVPSLGIPQQAKGIVDLYDASTDWIPIYDKSSLPGFYMACGSSGNQFKNAPIAGRMMADLVEYCENGNDHDQVPMPFHLPYIDHTIDTGFYSRKRAINSESSFSVIG
ncbi:MAG: FAD-binding oxidoreductase [Granulosicoccus sp.]|nr:FAD-binding oxidoreductase [Granulosicoccus sp.]